MEEAREHIKEITQMAFPATPRMLISPTQATITSCDTIGYRLKSGTICQRNTIGYFNEKGSEAITGYWYWDII